jgi:hypothetical protein
MLPPQQFGSAVMLQTCTVPVGSLLLELYEHTFNLFSHTYRSRINTASYGAKIRCTVGQSQ